MVDSRKREYILPVRIFKTLGSVKNADKLLKEKVPQIDITEPCVTEICALSGVVLDFGLEYHGGIKILTYATGEDVCPVRIRFGESVVEVFSEIGEKGATNDHSLRDFHTQLLNFSMTEVGQTGFRFVRIDNLSNKSVFIKSVLGIYVHSGLELTGSFECGDDLINRIFETAKRTIYLNMQEYLWDGIKRDRLVWMGDIYPEMLAIVALFGKNEILEKSLDFACNQSPLPRWINNIPMYSMWWIITCYDYFNHTGDLEFLKTNKNYLEELLDCIDKSIDENGEMNYDPYFLDWPTRYTDDAVTGTRILNTVALQDAIKILNYINADISVAEKCLNKLQQKKIPFSQAKQIIGLKHWLGLQLDPTEKELLIKDGASGISTFMSYFILNAISETAGIETANSIMKEYYGGMLNMGATSFWEDFDISWLKDNPSPIDRLPKDGQKSIHADFGQHCYTGLRHSLCHGWSSGVIYYIFKRILGVKILAPGCRKIELNPNLSSMSFAKGNFPTPYGIITIKCKQEKGKLKVVCNAPKEVEIICSM